jgi:hypothetical protein
MYRLPAEGGATPGTPASQDGKPILEPYAGLEVRPAQARPTCSCKQRMHQICMLRHLAVAGAVIQHAAVVSTTPVLHLIAVWYVLLLVYCSPCSRNAWQPGATTPPTAMTSLVCLTMRCVASGQHALQLGSRSLCHHLESWWRLMSWCWKVCYGAMAVACCAHSAPIMTLVSSCCQLHPFSNAGIVWTILTLQVKARSPATTCS